MHYIYIYIYIISLSLSLLAAHPKQGVVSSRTAARPVMSRCALSLSLSPSLSLSLAVASTTCM